MIAQNLARALEVAGLSGEAASAHAVGFDHLLAALRAERRDQETWDAWYVPGRIEVLGKHTDYGGGRSLICAAERGFHVVSAPRADRLVAMTDLGRGAALVLDVDGPLPDVSWATYPLTVLRRLARNFPEMIRGVDLVFKSDLPSAAGMSSSSALMIVALLALVRANDLDRTTAWLESIRNDRDDLAAYAATIENGTTFRGLAGEGGVGTEGGSEDHTAILCSEPSRVAQDSFCPTRRERSISLAAGLVLAIGVSGVAARKTGEARDDYNRASRNAGRVLELWRTRLAGATSRSPRRPRPRRTLLLECATCFETTTSCSTASTNSSRKAPSSCRPPPMSSRLAISTHSAAPSRGLRSLLNGSSAIRCPRPWRS